MKFEQNLKDAGFRESVEYGGWLHEEKRIGVLSMAWGDEEPMIHQVIEYRKFCVNVFRSFDDAVRWAIGAVAR